MSGGRDSIRLGAVVSLVLILGLDPALADTLSGVVTDTGGAPVADVDFDVFTWDGAKLPADDTSDSDGSYEVVLPPGRYDVVCQPPSSSGLAAQVRRGVQVAGKTRLDWRLPASVRVLGRVQALDGTPLASADLDFDRVADGTRQPAEGDTTDLSGVFVAHVEAGTYRITVFPPDGVDLAPARLAAVTVPSSDTLRFTLLPAAHLSGRVRGPRNGSVAGARLVFVEVGTGVRVPAWGHVTASDGTFRVGIAPGRYEVVIEPPSGSRLVALLSSPLDLNSDRTENFDLEEGVLLTGRVLDRGMPVGNAEWDATDETSGVRRVLAHNHTDYDGAFALALPASVYRLRLTPAPGTMLDSLVLPGFPLRRDTSVVIDLGGSRSAAWMSLLVRGNPTYRSARLRLGLAAGSEVRVELFDISGRRVRSLWRGWLAPGVHDLEWDGRNESGGLARAGVYFVRAVAEAGHAVARLVLLP